MGFTNALKESKISNASTGATTECRTRFKAIFFIGLFGSAVDERLRNNLCDVKSCVHIFSGSFGSAVNERTRNNLYDV